MAQTLTETRHDVRVSRMGRMAYCETCGWHVEAPGMRTALRLASEHEAQS